jgi:hypothetical protein
MEEAIEQRGHGGGVTEQLAPVVNRSVRRQHGGRAFIPADDGLQKIFSGCVRQPPHAKIVNDEERITARSAR